MSSVVVVGTQWGDEGKGKVVDYLAEQADLVVRYSGGSNAGHTVVANNKTYKLHLLPSGILYPNKLCIVGNGVVIDPEKVLEEIANMKTQHVDTSNLRISTRAHVILPYHKILDELQENDLGDKKIGTTKKGIGPCYADKATRTGIRICDLMDKEVFLEKLTTNLAYKNRLFKNMYNAPELDLDTVYQQYLVFAQQLRPYVADTGSLLQENISAGKKTLFEGAQASFLDLDHGTYPYVTSSNPIAGGVCTGAGVAPKQVGTAVGVVKAYSTRVGEGPFVTELLDETGHHIRERGHEYGTTTGRPRRCGWLDACVVRYAAQLNGLDYLAITRLDILDELATLKICVGYKLNGELIKHIPASLKELAACEPIYEEFAGWQQDITNVRAYKDLPENAKRYLERLSEITQTPLGIVSVGPSREQTMIMCELFK